MLSFNPYQKQVYNWIPSTGHKDIEAVLSNLMSGVRGSSLMKVVASREMVPNRGSKMWRVSLHRADKKSMF